MPDDETSSESCLHCEIHDLVQEQVEGQEKFDLVALAANLEEASRASHPNQGQHEVPPQMCIRDRGTISK